MIGNPNMAIRAGPLFDLEAIAEINVKDIANETAPNIIIDKNSSVFSI